MGLFTRKPIASDEYNDLSNKIIKLNTEVAILKGEFEKIETRFKSLHTKIVRMKEDEDDADEDTRQVPLSPADIQRGLMGLS